MGVINKVKTVFVVFAVCLAAAGFTACSNGLSFKETTDVSVAIPSEVYEEVAARSAWCEPDMDISTKVELFIDSVAQTPVQKDFKKGQEQTVSFEFKDIPLKSIAYAQITLTQDGIDLAQGKSVEITIKKGKNQIVVPLDFIKYSVPRTGYMLYKERKEGEDIVYDYYLCDKLETSIPDTREPDFKNVVAYCFDAEGYVYALTSGANNKYFEESNKPGFEKKELMLTRGMSIKNLFCDYATNRVYVQCNDSQENSFSFSCLNDYSYYISGNYDVLSFDRDSVVSILVNNNVLYFFEKQFDDEDKLIYKISKRMLEESETPGIMNVISSNNPNDEMELDLTGCVINAAEEKQINPYYEILYDTNFQILNIFYQDGYFYILYTYSNCYYGTEQRNAKYNYGGIVKVNFATKQVKLLNTGTDVLSLKQGSLSAYRYYYEYGVGYTDLTKILKSKNQTDYFTYSYDEVNAIYNGLQGDDYYSGLYEILVYQSGGEQVVENFTEEERNQKMSNLRSTLCTNLPLELKLEIFDTKIYSPSSIQSKNLFGPREVVALKPKRLVISDEGRFFYTDSNNVWRFKDINRYVIIDLDSFTIKTVTPSDTKITMGKGENVPIGNIDSNYFNADNVLRAIGGNAYCYQGTDYVNAHDEVSLGIYPED